MAAKYTEGDKVKWNWGDGEGTGSVAEVHTSRVEMTIKGTEVARDADDDEPAYLIEQADGDLVLKSESELEAA